MRTYIGSMVYDFDNRLSNDYINAALDICIDFRRFIFDKVGIYYRMCALWQWYIYRLDDIMFCLNKIGCTIDENYKLTKEHVYNTFMLNVCKSHGINDALSLYKAFDYLMQGWSKISKDIETNRIYRLNLYKKDGSDFAFEHSMWENTKDEYYIVPYYYDGKNEFVITNSMQNVDYSSVEEKDGIIFNEYCRYTLKKIKASKPSFILFDKKERKDVCKIGYDLNNNRLELWDNTWEYTIAYDKTWDCGYVTKQANLKKIKDVEDLTGNEYVYENITVPHYLRHGWKSIGWIIANKTIASDEAIILTLAQTALKIQYYKNRKQKRADQIELKERTLKN